jgi:hypothetical protein
MFLSNIRNFHLGETVTDFKHQAHQMTIGIMKGIRIQNNIEIKLFSYSSGEEK